MLQTDFVLWPGNSDNAVKFREKVYYFASEENKITFMDNPLAYLPVKSPLQPPPLRVFMLGPTGAGKTFHGKRLAQKLHIFHMSFRERLQVWEMSMLSVNLNKNVGAQSHSFLRFHCPLLFCI